MAIAAMIAWDVSLFSREKPKRNWLSMAGTGLLLLSSCAGLHLLVPGFSSGSTYGSGGAVGAWTGAALTQWFSPAGIFILTACGLLSGWMLSPLWAISMPGVRVASIPWNVVSSVGSAVRALRPAPRMDADDDEDPDTLSINTVVDYDDEGDDDQWEEEDEDDEVLERDIRINPPVSLSVHSPVDDDEYQYDLPDMDLLEEPEDFPYDLLAKKARIAAATLEKTFQQFGLNIRVSEVDTGPTVTQFELDLEPGLRLNKVTALEDDLAIALRRPRHPAAIGLG